MRENSINEFKEPCCFAEIANIDIGDFCEHLQIKLFNTFLKIYILKFKSLQKTFIKIKIKRFWTNLM